MNFLVSFFYFSVKEFLHDGQIDCIAVFLVLDNPQTRGWYRASGLLQGGVDVLLVFLAAGNLCLHFLPSDSALWIFRWAGSFRVSNSSSKSVKENALGRASSHSDGMFSLSIRQQKHEMKEILFFSNVWEKHLEGERLGVRETQRGRVRGRQRVRERWFISLRLYGQFSFFFHRLWILHSPLRWIIAALGQQSGISQWVASYHSVI